VINKRKREARLLKEREKSKKRATKERKAQKKERLILALVFFIPLIIGVVILSFDKLDPFYRTEATLEAKILSMMVSRPRNIGGKSGVPPILDGDGRFGKYYKITVKAKNGKIYAFKKPSTFFCFVGDKIFLSLYKRKITRLQRYKLEKCK
jgi:hypothetical protein